MSRKSLPSIAIDLDGVLAQYSPETDGGFSGKIGDPYPWSKLLLGALYPRFQIIIHTARISVTREDFSAAAKQHGHDNTVDAAFLLIHSARAAITEWMNRHELPFDIVWAGFGKPKCKAFIDDRAMHVSRGLGMSRDCYQSVVAALDRLIDQTDHHNNALEPVA